MMMVKLMNKKKYNIDKLCKKILNDINCKYINLIRGYNPSFFTRVRKVTPVLELIRMDYSLMKRTWN